MSTVLRWTAGGPDGIAHLHVAGRVVCHAEPIAEPFAWPTVTRCPACLRRGDPPSRNAFAHTP